MAEPHDNSISRDSIETRLHRLLRMQNNIDTYAAGLGITGALLAWAQGCYDRFFAAVVASQNEDGESKDATLIVHDKFAVAQDYYQQAKDILDAKLKMYKPDEHLKASYGIDKATPETYHALTVVIGDMIDTHDELTAAADERVIAQAIIDQLKIHGDDFLVAIETAGIEKRESDVAFNQQHTYFDEDTENLRYIFTVAKLTWGRDDPKLKDLGFVPASEIWTPGQPEPGMPVFPEAVANLKVELGVIEKPEITFDYATQDGVTFNIYKDAVKIGDPIPTELPAEPWLKGVESHSVTDPDPENNRTNVYWVVPVFEGEEGDVAGPVTIDYKPGAEPVPE